MPEKPDATGLGQPVVNLNVYYEKETFPTAALPMDTLRVVETSRYKPTWPIVAMGCFSEEESAQLENDLLDDPLLFGNCREGELLKMKRRNAKRSKERKKLMGMGSSTLSSVSATSRVGTEKAPEKAAGRSIGQTELGDVTPTLLPSRSSSKVLQSGRQKYLRDAKTPYVIGSGGSQYFHLQRQKSMAMDKDMAGSPSLAPSQPGVRGENSSFRGEGFNLDNSSFRSGDEVVPAPPAGRPQPPSGPSPRSKPKAPTSTASVGFKDLFYDDNLDRASSEPNAEGELHSAPRYNPFENVDEDILEMGKQLIGLPVTPADMSRPHTSGTVSGRSVCSSRGSTAQGRRRGSTVVPQKMPAVRVTPAELQMSPEERRASEKAHRVPPTPNYSRRSTELPFEEGTRPKTVYFSETQQKIMAAKQAAGTEMELNRPATAPGAETRDTESEMQFFKKFNHAVSSGKRRELECTEMVRSIARRGIKHHAKGDYEKAEKRLTKAIESHRSSPSPPKTAKISSRAIVDIPMAKLFVRRAQTRLARNDIENSNEDANIALDIDPLCPGGFATKSVTDLRMGNVLEAATTSMEGLEEHPHNKTMDEVFRRSIREYKNQREFQKVGVRPCVMTVAATGSHGHPERYKGGMAEVLQQKDKYIPIVQGSFEGGTGLVIRGSNLGDPSLPNQTKVFVGENEATEVTIINATAVLCVTPPGKPNTIVNVNVQLGGCMSANVACARMEYCTPVLESYHVPEPFTSERKLHIVIYGQFLGTEPDKLMVVVGGKEAHEITYRAPGRCIEAKLRDVDEGENRLYVKYKGFGSSNDLEVPLAIGEAPIAKAKAAKPNGRLAKSYGHHAINYINFYTAMWKMDAQDDREAEREKICRLTRKYFYDLRHIHQYYCVDDPVVERDIEPLMNMRAFRKLLEATGLLGARQFGGVSVDVPQATLAFVTTCRGTTFAEGADIEEVAELTTSDDFLDTHEMAACLALYSIEKYWEQTKSTAECYRLVLENHLVPKAKKIEDQREFYKYLCSPDTQTVIKKHEKVSRFVFNETCRRRHTSEYDNLHLDTVSLEEFLELLEERRLIHKDYLPKQLATRQFYRTCMGTWIQTECDHIGICECQDTMLRTRVAITLKEKTEGEILDRKMELCFEDFIEAVCRTAIYYGGRNVTAESLESMENIVLFSEVIDKYFKLVFGKKQLDDNMYFAERMRIEAKLMEDLLAGFDMPEGSPIGTPGTGRKSKRRMNTARGIASISSAAISTGI